MKLGINILLGIAAGIAFLYTIGDNPKQPISSKERRITATVALVALLLFIVAFNTIM